MVGIFSNLRTMYGDCLSIASQLKNIHGADIIKGILRSMTIKMPSSHNRAAFQKGEPDEVLHGWRVGLLEKRLWEVRRERTQNARGSEALVFPHHGSGGARSKRFIQNHTFGED